ncbi:MAG: hypothetical protein H3C54_06680 [Taibaiella sp.]|nr:hypothetical protein [Taibaiella sp.]
MSNTNTKGFDWGGLFDVIGLGINAGANIHAANKQTEIAKMGYSYQQSQAANVRFSALLGTLSEANKQAPKKILAIMIPIALMLLALGFIMRKR